MGIRFQYLNTVSQGKAFVRRSAGYEVVTGARGTTKSRVVDHQLWDGACAKHPANFQGRITLQESEQHILESTSEFRNGVAIRGVFRVQHQGQQDLSHTICQGWHGDRDGLVRLMNEWTHDSSGLVGQFAFERFHQIIHERSQLARSQRSVRIEAIGDLLWWRLVKHAVEETNFAQGEGVI